MARGLPGRDPFGEPPRDPALPPTALVGMPPAAATLFLILLRVSLISPSLPDAAPRPAPLLRLRLPFSVILFGSRLSFRDEPARGCSTWPVRPPGGGGDPGREPEGVPLVATAGCFFLIFLRVDSLPLASEGFGEPGRFRIFLMGSAVEFEEGLEVPEGVLVPLVVCPDELLGLSVAGGFSGWAWEDCCCCSF